MPFADLTRIAGELDIGIAPLADSEFSRSRSNVKLKEYAAGGAAWLAPNVGPYRGLGPSERGRLVDGDRWLEALDELVKDRLARHGLSRRALRWATSQTIDSNASVWEDAFEGRATARQADRSEARPSRRR